MQQYAVTLRALADRLERGTGEPATRLLSAVLGDDGVLALASRMASRAGHDLDRLVPLDHPEPEAHPAYQLRHHLADAEEAIGDALAEADVHSPPALEQLTARAAVSPAEAAAKGSLPQSPLRSSPAAPERSERLYLFTVDGTDEYGPYPGLVDPASTTGHVGSYCSPAFARPVAEQIVRDIDPACGLTGVWEDDGRLRLAWSTDYDGDGGQEEVQADERGLYRIGGLWPWDYTEAPPAAEPAARLGAARSTRDDPAPDSRTEPVTTTVADPARALRQLTEQLRSTADPAQAAGLIEKVTAENGALEALSDFLGAAGTWARDRPGAEHLWQPLAWASDEVYEAGADITRAPDAIRALAERPALIRSAAGQRRSAAPTAPPPPAPTAAAASSRRGR